MKDKIVIASFQSLTALSAGGIGQLGFMLAREFFRRNKLKTFVVSSKGKYTTEFPSSAVSAWSRYYLFLLNKAEQIFKMPVYRSRYLQEFLYDRSCARHLDHTVRKLVVTTPYMYYTFQKAKELNIEILFIPGNPEDNYIAQLVTEENAQYGITKNDAYTYQRRLNYYNRSLGMVDKIITYSSVMEGSYRQAGHGDKLITARGYLKPLFSKQKRIKSEKGQFKVVFLAYTVLLKGLQYLLEAWKELQHYQMELHIGGTIDDNVQSVIDRNYSGLQNVSYHGLITDVPGFFSDKSLYVLPSIIDGAPVTILEAMHSGIPVIISEKCGTKDIIEQGKSGWIVPSRDARALRDTILEAYKQTAQTEQMGEYAKTVIDHYNMDDFVLRLAAAIEDSKIAGTVQMAG